MQFTRETGRRFLIEGERITTRRVADGDRLAKVLGESKPAGTSRRSGYSTAIEEIAGYMVRGFHDWAAQGRYHLEPGFRRLIGEKDRVITVHYLALRDDWEDDCRRGLDAWQELGFEFREVDDPSTADVVVDDEKKGAYALRRFGFVRRGPGGRPVVKTVGREINIWKEWPEWHLHTAIVHEIGHALGLGHPGPYNGTRPTKPLYEADNAKNTVMSYYGNNGGRIGDADRLAVEMIYG